MRANMGCTRTLVAIHAPCTLGEAVLQGCYARWSRSASATFCGSAAERLGSSFRQLHTTQTIIQNQTQCLSRRNRGHGVGSDVQNGESGLLERGSSRRDVMLVGRICCPKSVQIRAVTAVLLYAAYFEAGQKCRK